MRIHKTKSDSQPAKRKDGTDAVEFALLERLFIFLVKSCSVNAKTRGYFRNLLYLCHDDEFSFPPNQAVHSSFLVVFVILCKGKKNFMTLTFK